MPGTIRSRMNANHPYSTTSIVGIRVFVASSLALLSVLAHAGPREDVNDVANLIDANYFDTTRAVDIAGGLRKDAAAGEFDRYVDRNDLIVALTLRLQKVDAHFRVALAPRSQGDVPPPGRPPAANDNDSRANYGFRRIERLPGNIAYLELTFVANINFGDSNSPARRAADAAIDLIRGADAVILDLRANGGGAPSMVGYLVSAFVKSDADIYNVFHSRMGTQSERPDVLYPKPMLDVPLFVLTSARTGSAAESIAFTLQSAGRAKVVGERSGGAANPGRMFVTPQGLAVFVSTGSPRNPINGRNWEGDGVAPDATTATSQALHRAHELALEKVIASSSSPVAKSEGQWVLEALRNQESPYQAKRLDDYAGSYGPFLITGAMNALEARNGRREPLILVPLNADAFCPAADPSRRFVFERDAKGVIALRVLTALGDEQRFNRVEQREK